MIRVSISSLLLLLVCCTLGPVLLVWGVGAWRRRVHERALLKGMRHCALCFYEFLPGPSPAPGVPCPKCGAPSRPKRNLARL